jgi:hypothetical protein
MSGFYLNFDIFYFRFVSNAFIFIFNYRRRLRGFYVTTTSFVVISIVIERWFNDYFISFIIR